MKKIKKLISIMLIAVMALAMGTTAFAASSAGDGTDTPGTYSITINNAAAGHTYEAYQIFSGDLSRQGNDFILSNIKWGSGVTEEGQTELRDAKERAKALEGKDDKVVAAFAQEVGAYLVDTPAGTSVPGDGNYVISGLKPGYYLVKDQDNSLQNDDSYTSFILEVVADATATPKNSGVPTPDKGVKDINDSTGDKSDDYEKSADYDIGDNVPYQLKATLPDTVSAYKTYKLVFHDELSTGLDYVYENDDPSSGVTVKVGDKKIETGYTVTYNNHILEVTFEDVKVAPVSAESGSIITVEYTAKLNDKAKIGSEGNINTLTLKYSNNPNNNGQGMGKSEEIIAVVFTFKTVVNKIDENKNPLTGAAFKLEKKYLSTTVEWKEVDRYEVNDEGTTFTFEGLDDGIYRLTETKTPDGYNSIEPIYFRVEATHDQYKGENNTGLSTLKVYACDENGKELSGENVTGFTIEKIKDSDGDDTNNKPTGTASTNIVNKKGSLLPSTGGIGTTIFYIVGAAIIVGVGVILVTKRRMSNQG